MNYPVSNSVLRALIITAALCYVVGCATAPSKPPLAPEVSPQFIGYWTNVVAGYENWWVIEPHSVVNYGTALSGGRCTGNSAKILSLDRLEVQFGNASIVSLSKSNGMMLFTAPHGIAVHKRVPKTDICRKANGEYYEGAPYVGG